MSRSSTSSSEDAGTAAPTPAPSRGDAVATTSAAVTAPGIHRAVALFATGFFLLIVFGCALVDWCAPVAAPKLVGFEKTAQDQRRAAAHFSDGSLAKLIEDDLRLTSRVRRTALAVYSPLLLRVFDEAGATYLAGPNGFLFRRDRTRVATGDRDATLGLATGRLRALSRFLGHLGARVVAMPLPRKCVAMAHELPTGLEVHPEHDALFAERLREAGVELVDLLPVFAASADDPVYAPADTHWSSHGALLAARALAQALRPDHTPTEPVLLATSGDGRSQLAHALGLDPLAEPLLPATDVRQLFFAHRQDFAVDSRPPAQGPLPLLLAGTSFSKHATDESTLFAELLSAMLDQPIWNGAKAGATTNQSLAQSLARCRGRALPPCIVLELPNHYMFCTETPLADLGEVFRQLPVPAAYVPLQHDHPDQFGLPDFIHGSNLLAGEYDLPPGPPRLSRVAWGSFVYPRDGTVVAVLRGQVTGGPLELTIDTDASRLFQHWPAEQTEVALPVAGDRVGTRLDLSARAIQPGTHVVLSSVAICCDLDLAAGRPGIPSSAEGPIRSGDDAWSQAFEFPTAPPSTDDCIGITLDDPSFDLASRQIDARFADGSTVRLFGPAELQQKARLLLSLGSARHTLRSILVSGSGAPPARPVRVWQLQRR